MDTATLPNVRSEFGGHHGAIRQNAEARAIEADRKAGRYAALFPADEHELDAMLAAPQQTPPRDRTPAHRGLATLERRMNRMSQ